MIKKLNHNDEIVSKKIQSVFYESYAVEANILKAVNFPPLKRQLKDFIVSTNSFYGYLTNNEIAGAVEVKEDTTFIHIQSLVVKPTYFRQGIAQQLLDFVFNKIPSQKYMVETGIDNIPAVNLYLKNGFLEIKQWDTDHGVRKVRFEKI